MWKKIGERLGYQGWRRIRIKQFQLPDGNTAEFDIVSSASFATIAAFTEDQQAILIRQYRPGPERELLSFAEGAIDAGETPLLAAQRELLEETGYVSEDWTFLKKRNSAYTDQHQYFFLARNCRRIQAPQPDGGEFLTLELMSLPQLKALLRDPQEDSFSNVDAAYLALDWMATSKPATNMQNPSQPALSTEDTPLLEICCDHLHSALAARDGGADRIELCTALSTDGLTPSAGLLATVRERLDIPIFVLIRPRPGNFSYTTDELEVMLKDIHHCKALGADGIVSGALRTDKRIDLEATARLVAAARPLPFTFHKAFDLTPDPLDALEQLIALGVDRVLTSGHEATALEGREVLAKLVERGAEKINILCGGGVRHHNLRELLAIPGLKEFHSAAKRESRGYAEVDREIVLMMKQVLA